ncbi:MAG: glycoside hydrolase family 2 TIM barrel-domain containing protein [Rhodothermales bacterium]|nr:glycoside hydrolase family 2 TIM barrel-domain containing protein [Rhodothermales bacterium]
MISTKHFIAATVLAFGVGVVDGQPADSPAYEGPVRVELRQEGETWTLYRGGRPYYIKGVGGSEYLDRAVAYGANSVRTWGAHDAIAILDEAHRLGLTVVFGLWAGQERQGFDYDDAKSVEAQLERFREIVRTYKDHPAVLMWGLGNEVDLFYSDFKVWNALNDIAEMIHEEDPNHPVMTVTAGLDVAEVHLIQDRAPAIDIYGVNTYGGLLGIDRQFRRFGWKGPYIVAEWGPDGHWEVPKTAWGVPIEQTSSEKAKKYLQRYTEGIAADPQKCIGSYVFLWGQKQETTPTWYGVFLPGGYETEVMDVLQYVWTGSWPDNRAPAVTSLTIDGSSAYDDSYVVPRRTVTAKVDASDPEGEPLRYEWELLPESTDIRAGGDAESKPDALDISVVKQSAGELTFRAPRLPGPYRLFSYVYDGHGNAATANIPFYVGQPREESQSSASF